MCALYWCVDAPLVSACLTPRMDSAGKPACELCGRRLSTIKHKHKHGPGHACHPRCKPQKGEADSQEQYYPTGTRSGPSATARQKRSYETLRPTQRWERRKRARQALQQLGVPVQALQPPSTPSPAVRVCWQLLLHPLFLPLPEPHTPSSPAG